MNLNTLAATIGLAALLAGCDMAPKYVRPALPVAPTLPASAAHEAQGQTASAAPDLAWQSFFVEPRLRELIGLALTNNRDLRVAAANIEQARALYRVQRADLLPTVGASGSATYQKNPFGIANVGTGSSVPGAGTGTGTGAGTAVAGNGQVDIYSASVGISAWEIDLFGRLRNLSKSALEQYLATAADRDAVQTSLIAELAGAWLTMAADQERLRIARDTEKAFGRTLELTRARFAKGVASELDVHQATTTWQQAASDIAEATTLIAQDRNALDLLAGRSVPTELLPEELSERPATIDQLPADISSGVLLRRPDIVAAEHRLRAANANIGAARAAFFPNISLTAAFGTISLGLSNLFGSNSDFWSVAPSASLPLFDFGRNKGNLRYSEATRTAMVAQYERSIQVAFREVADALARRRTIDAQLRAQAGLREAAAGAYRLSEARFRVGVDPFLATLDSQRALYAAQRSLLATELVKAMNVVELYRSLGGGLS